MQFAQDSGRRHRQRRLISRTEELVNGKREASLFSYQKIHNMIRPKMHDLSDLLTRDSVYIGMSPNGEAKAES
jgi:hypothetical protein